MSAVQYLAPLWVSNIVLCMWSLASNVETDILVGFKGVTANSHSDSVDFRLVWMHSAYKIAVSDFAVWSYLPWLDEKHGVVSFDNVTWFEKLGEPSRATSNLIGK